MTRKEESTVREFVREIKKALGENLIVAKLFGSKVRDDFSSDSDIDLLLVVKNKTPEIRETVFTVLFEIDPYYQLKISPVIYSVLEYKRNEEMGSPLKR